MSLWKLLSFRAQVNAVSKGKLPQYLVRKQLIKAVRRNVK